MSSHAPSPTPPDGPDGLQKLVGRMEIDAPGQAAPVGPPLQRVVVTPGLRETYAVEHGGDKHGESPVPLLKIPLLKTARPQNLENLPPERISARVSAALEQIRQVIEHAYVPYHGYHVGAALILDDRRIVTGVNVDSQVRGKSCAEKNALAEAHEFDFERITAVVTLSLSHGPVPNRPPVCPCGNCRTVLSRFTGAETAVIMSSTDGTNILGTTMEALLPLGYGRVSDGLAHGLRGLSELTRGQRTLVDLAVEATPRSTVPFSRLPVGSALETERGTLVSGWRIESDSHIGGHAAETVAITRAVKRGDTHFTRIAITPEYTDSNPWYSPSGESRQYLFEFAQLWGVDTEVILRLRDGSFLVTSAANLLPLGLGPIDYGDDRLDEYRRVGGSLPRFHPSTAPQ